MPDRRLVRIIGPGRAGGALAAALTGAGWPEPATLDRGDDLVGAASGVDLLIVAVPDPEIAEVAGKVVASDATVVVHLAGSLGLDVLDPHPRRAGLHPLVALPDPIVGARRLVGAWWGVAGDPMAIEVVTALAGRSFFVADKDRTNYHAAAVIASNHLVALMGQVDRVAATAGAPLEAYLDLARGALENVAAMGAAAALTGPIVRGDEATVARHLAALAPAEREAYIALADAARVLARTGRDQPGDEVR